MPRVVELARSAAWRGYRHEPWRRAPGLVAVQLTLAGLGGVWRDPAAPPRLLPRGAALVFRTGVDRIVYGLPPGGGGRWEFVYATLAGAAAEAMAGDLIAAHGHVLALDPAHPLVAELLTHDRGRERGELVLPPARAARLACDLLLALAEGVPAADEDGGLAAAARGVLERRLAEAGAIAACARELGISREHLARAFARATGEPPSAWLRRRRIAVAAALLADDPTLPVATVAARCGFATASHFVHAFRRARGTTPAAFRRGTDEATRM